MIIDIVIAILLLLAIVLGIRQGLITQICTLIAVVATSVIAPSVATPIGQLVVENEVIAFAIGFATMLLGAIILVWLIAPLFKRLIKGKMLGKVNALAGACVAFVSMLLIIAIGCSALNSANIGELDNAKMLSMLQDSDNQEQMQAEMGKILKRDASMRDYFKPRFIAYDTLDESLLFNGFVWIGDTICPRIKEMRMSATEEIKSYATESII